MSKKILSNTRKFLLAMFIALSLVIMVSLPFVYAASAEIADVSAQSSGSPLNLQASSSFKGGLAHNYCSNHPTRCSNSVWGMWDIPNYRPAATYSFEAWIPLNGLPADATVKYYVSGYTGYSHWTPVINQENYANVWVWLGSEYATGSGYLGQVTLYNTCYGVNCTYTEVWWDNVKYSW